MICPMCNHKLALATGYATSFDWHSEPYDAEEAQKVFDASGDEIELDLELCFSIEICPICRWHTVPCFEE